MIMISSDQTTMHTTKMSENFSSSFEFQMFKFSKYEFEFIKIFGLFDTWYCCTWYQVLFLLCTAVLLLFFFIGNKNNKKGVWRLVLGSLCPTAHNNAQTFLPVVPHYTNRAPNPMRSPHLVSTAVRIGALLGCRTSRVQGFVGGGGSSGTGTHSTAAAKGLLKMTNTATSTEPVGAYTGPALRTYVDGNARGPVLVFVHGWPDDHTMWDKQV